MSKGKINLQKQGGGILSISSVDGNTNTEIIIPESGLLVTKKDVEGKPLTTENINALVVDGQFGEYHQDSDALATLERGYPILEGGRLHVFKSSHVGQVYITRSNKMFVRNLYGGSWSLWEEYATKAYVDSVFGAGVKGSYGLRWNQETDVYTVLGASDRTQIQVHMKRCVLNSDGTVNYFLDPYNSTLKEDGTPAVLDGTDGNVMVQIPKFWYRHELNGNEHQWWVSDRPLPGFEVHPWFREWGLELPYRYYRAYEGFVKKGKLMSVSGVTPTRSQTRNTFRTQARANGAGWNLCSWNAVNAVQILYLTEYCTLNAQSVLGSGNDTGDDYGMVTGQSNVIGNASSGPLNNNTWMSYRGIENWYADIWEFVDGINVRNYKVYLNQNPDTFADDIFTGDYEDSGVTVPAASASYVKKISGNFLPTALGGSSSTYVTDGFWSATGDRIALFGGGAFNGALGGAFCLFVGHAAAGVDVSFGAGLSR